MEAMQFTNNKGTPFMVRIVRKGNGYGMNFCITHNEDQALVEFYDARYPHTAFGQFVSRYYITTIVENSDRDCGLDLMGYEPQWKIDANTMKQIVKWLNSEMVGA